MNTKRKKSKKRWIIPLIAAGALIQAGFFFMVYLFLFGGPPYVTAKIEEYPRILEKYSNVQTGFAVFPETLSEDMLTSEPDFYFAYRDTWDDPTMEVMLRCSFSDEAYENELERLQRTHKTYGEETRGLQYSEERFRYPAYIAIDGLNRGYEYALLTGENEITYVYFAFMSSVKMKHIPNIYLPVGYDMDYVKDDRWDDGYSIYLDPTGSDESVHVLDYTRGTSQ